MFKEMEAYAGGIQYAPSPLYKPKLSNNEKLHSKTHKTVIASKLCIANYNHLTNIYHIWIQPRHLPASFHILILFP